MWVWEYETEEGAHDLYMDTGEEIRFRVVDESFVDTSPTGPGSAEATSSSEEPPKKEAPYTLVVSCPDAAARTAGMVWGQPRRWGGGGAASEGVRPGFTASNPSPRRSGCGSLFGS